MRSWTAFLLAAFGVLGLVAAFSIYAAQLPLARLAARDAVLARVAAGEAMPAAALGDSAGVLIGAGDLGGRVAAEQSRLIAASAAEARDIGLRLRIVLAVFTGAAALFGAMVLSVVRRR